MGRFVAPINPYEIVETGCLKVFFPDSPFFRRALVGQITKLENRFVWDTGGDIDAANHIEQLWLQHGEMTRAAYKAGCSDCGDLQDQIDELTTTIEEYENMEINVNVECGCGGCGCGDFTVPTLPDGTKFPLVPINPNDPLGEIDQTWDYENEIPPDGWGSWGEFDEQRCIAANWFVDSYIQLVAQMDKLENEGSTYASIIDVAVFILAALPGPVGDYAGVVVVLGWLRDVLNLLTTVLDELEDLNDWLQNSVTDIEEHKQELVCAVYSMSTTAYIRDFFLTFFLGNVQPGMESAGASAEFIDWMRDAMSSLFNRMAVRINDSFSNSLIPDGYVPEIDCGVCGNLEPIDGFTFEPMYLGAIEPGTGIGGGTSNAVATLSGNKMQCSATANSPSQVFTPQVYVNAPTLVQGGRYCGIVLRISEMVNCTELRYASGNNTEQQMWTGSTGNVASEDIYIIHDDADVTQFQAGLPGATVFVSQSDLHVNDCDLPAMGIEIGSRSTAAGEFSFTIGKLYLIRQTSLDCP